MPDKLFQIFRAGKHQTMAGNALVFSENDLKNIATGYDVRELAAPLVLGHPANNLPEYGTVDALFVENGGLYAQANVNDALHGMVKAGYYNNVSASFFAPLSSENPTPGVYYLRHVGFLGAYPPAVKGLSALAFTEPSHDVNFAEGFGIQPEVVTEKFVVAAGWQVDPVQQNIFNLAKDYQRVCPSMSFAEAVQRAETIVINH